MNTYALHTRDNKIQSIATAVARNNTNRPSIAQLINNRPEAIQRRKLQQLADNRNQSFVVQRHVIQFTIDELIALVKSNDKKGFSAKLRSMKPGMDEMISCEVTFDLARKAYLAGDLLKVREICERSDATRLPTEWTGSSEVSSTGVVSSWAHPTATTSTMPNHPWNMPTGNSGTHYKSTGHGTFNNERKKEVLAETGGPHQQQGVAISYTLGHVAPPYAPGVTVNPAITDQEKDIFNAQREGIKKLHPNYDPTLQQAQNAPWAKQTRGVSPDRTLPKK